MYHRIFPLVLSVFLAACSISPLPQATAVIPTKPSPSITDTPQPTFTPAPTLTPTPIPELFVIQDGALLAWDASLGEYQAVVLSNGALPEGAQIIQSEIVASDGAVLYRFNANSQTWVEVVTVPGDVQEHVTLVFQEPGTPVILEDGTKAITSSDGRILAQETEAGWSLNWSLLGPEGRPELSADDYPEKISIDDIADFMQPNEAPPVGFPAEQLLAEKIAELESQGVNLENVTIELKTYGDTKEEYFRYDFCIISINWGKLKETEAY